MGRKFLIAASAFAGAMALAAQAGAVAVANSGFESPVVSGAAPGSFTGWQVGGNGGVINNDAALFVAPGGKQVGYAGTGYGILFQDVGAVTPGGKYTLTVDVGAAPGSITYDYRLLLGVWGPGGHDLATATIFAVAYDPVAIADGTFASVSLSGIAPGMSGDLVVFLENSNTYGFGTESGFDNVALSSGVPEPGAWALMLLGFSGLGLAMRARRRIAVA